MPKWALVLLVGLAALSVAEAAEAAERRIAVLERDEELLRALVLALSPWGVEPVRSDVPPPLASASEAIPTAARLSQELGVEAVVWVSSTERGALLWVFDAHTGEVMTRFLQVPPPFDSATAAAVALSVKTVLRPSLVAPPPQARDQPAPPAVPPSDPLFAVELGGGGRWLSPGEVQLRGELAAVAWIAAARRLGLSLELSNAPGLRLEDPRFRGRYRELALGGKVRFRLAHGPGASVAVALGGAARWTRLSGTLLADSEQRSVGRLDPSIDLESSAGLGVAGGVYLGAALGATYFPTYRRYLVEGAPVFSPWQLCGSLRGYLGVELF